MPTRVLEDGEALPFLLTDAKVCYNDLVMKLRRLNKASKWVVFVVALLSVPAFAFSPNIPIASAKTVEEVIREIEQKQKEMEEKQKVLDKAKAEGKSLSVRSGTLEDQLAQVNTDLVASQATLEATKIEIDELLANITILEQYIEEQKANLGKSATSLYQMSQMSDVERIFASDGLGEYVIVTSLRENVVEQSRTKIDELVGQVELVSSAKAMAETQKTTLEQLIADLATQQTSLNGELAILNAQIAENKKTTSSIKGQISGLQSDIDQLEEEQQRLLEEVERGMGGGGKQEIPLNSGDYYFSGRGRYSKQGHGVGMSQWGAYGMAEHGFTYSQILTHYYTNVTIGQSSVTTIPVSGHGNMNIETYVSGLGEVADKACGTVAQAQARPDKYVVDNPNSSWDCWPEESIKAQVVAARSYAINYTRPTSKYPNGKPICTDAGCQVYKGGTAKKWAADETTGQAVLYKSKVIGAYYHASAGGRTENNENIFATDGKTGTPYGYLRGVDESAYAHRDSYYNWRWSTNGFSKEEMRTMVNGVVATIKSAYNTSTTRYPYYNSLPNDIGEVTSVVIEQGASSRVKFITFKGTNGEVRINGLDFYICYNKWVSATGLATLKGKVYSLEFSIQKAQ